MTDTIRDTPFAVTGEMAELMDAYDWSATPLGPPETWPASLKSIVRVLLTSRFAMWMGWGPDLTFFYNDAYGRMTLGAKHPWALGRPFREVWSEVWPEIRPRIEQVLQSGEATWDEDLLLFLERSGFTEETYHTFSYSPLSDEHGVIRGNLCVVTEETDRVIGERRMALLRDLAATLASAMTEADVFAACEQVLAGSRDLPFSLTYLLDEHGSVARLVSRTGIAADHPGAVPVIDLARIGAPWTIDDLDDLTASRVVELPEGAGEWPRGPWPRPASMRENSRSVFTSFSSRWPLRCATSRCARIAGDDSASRRTSPSGPRSSVSGVRNS